MYIENSIRDSIAQFKTEICYFNQMHIFAMSAYEKNYYLNRIEEKTEALIEQIGEFVAKAQEIDTDLNIQTEFTVEELSAYDGSDGKPVYVAVNGVIYDLSNVVAWQGGNHNGLFAGKDLSAQFMGCHLGFIQVLEKYPKVGILKR